MSLVPFSFWKRAILPFVSLIFSNHLLNCSTYIFAKHFVIAVLIDKTLGFLFKFRRRVTWPPILQISIFIEIPTYNNKTSRHQLSFMEKYFPHFFCSYRFLSLLSSLCGYSILLRPRPHVSGYFWIRNFFFPDTAIVHTHTTNSQANPELFESALQSGNFWIR